MAALVVRELKAAKERLLRNETLNEERHLANQQRLGAIENEQRRGAERDEGFARELLDIKKSGVANARWVAVAAAAATAVVEAVAKLLE